MKRSFLVVGIVCITVVGAYLFNVAQKQDNIASITTSDVSEKQIIAPLVEPDVNRQSFTSSQLVKKEAEPLKTIGPATEIVIEGKFDRLLTVDEEIDTETQNIGQLIEKYDSDLANDQTKSELQQAISSETYKAAILEKFKLERDLAKSLN